MQDLIKIGRIIKSHGIVGELKIKLLHHQIGIPEHIFFAERSTYLPYFVENLKELKHPVYLLKLEGTDNKSDADKLAKQEAFIEENEFSKFFKENLEDDLSGYRVFDESDTLIGQIEEVIEMPAHPVFSIQYAGREVLLPYVDTFVKSIDHKKKIIIYILQEGLLDL